MTDSPDIPSLLSAKTVKAVLQKHNIRVKKGYGQNFLTDAGVLNKIVSAAELSSNDLAVEIGPGLGVLTRELAKRAGKVVAVEIDKTLIPALSENLAVAGLADVEIINADFLKINYDDVLSGELVKRPELKSVKVIANLPYYITTPIIFAVLEARRPAEIVVLTVQKEVADRMAARPGTKNYGALTLAVAYHAETEIAAKASPSCFFPQPGVDSAVIKLKIRKTPPVAADKTQLFTVIGAAFSTRRKTLVNCLSNSPALNITKERALSAVAKCGLPADIRGEALSLFDFAELCEVLFEHD